jgi:hypothetical protein
MMSAPKRRKFKIEMNRHEETAWRILSELGATWLFLGGKVALDVTSIRANSNRRAALFAEAVLGACGRSGAVRRHVDRHGRQVFLVADKISPTLERERNQAEGAVRRFKL